MAVTVFVALAAAPALCEKKVAVRIEHAAPLAGPLQSRPVVFDQVSGECSDEFRDLLARDMAAHGFVRSESVGNGSAAALTVSVRVDRCEARPREAMLGPGLPAMHISRTEGRFRAFIRVFDFAARTEIATLEARGEAGRQNESMTSIPEYPAVAEIRDMALQAALAEARRLYLPWIETREIPLKDDKGCNLRGGFDLARNADFGGFVAQARDAVDACRSNPKLAGAAWYNLGVALLLVKQYEGALAAFGEARTARDDRTVSELMDLCRRESALRASAAPRRIPVQPAGPEPRTGMLMTNDLVVRMVRANVDPAEIISLIRRHPGRFALGDEDVATLKQAGVPDDVISAMRASPAP